METQVLSSDEILKAWRKKPLFDPATLPVQCNWGKEVIDRLIPHRDPLQFVDRLLALDASQGLMAGSRLIDPADPVLAGHFPGSPVYPGNFTVESIGQLGLCMYYFHTQKRSDLGADAAPIALRATKMAGALFLEPVLPGDEVTLLAKVLSFDGYFASMVGQALVRGKVAVVCIGEAMILSD